MKRFLITIALSCVFSVSALAGEMPTCGVMSPEPSGTIQTADETAPGEIPSVPGDVPTGGFQQQVSDGALSALLSVLGLLTL